MDAGKTKEIRIFLFVIATLIIVFTVIDAIFFKMLSGSGLIALGICIMAMATSASAKSKEVKLKPKTAKMLTSITLVLFVSGLIAFFLII